MPKALYGAHDERQASGVDGEIVEFELGDERGVIRGVRFVNDLPLNVAREEESPNLFEFREVTTATWRALERTSTWARITSLEITPEDALEIARAARRRVENETFNTVERQGGHLERSDG